MTLGASDSDFVVGSPTRKYPFDSISTEISDFQG